MVTQITGTEKCNTGRQYEFDYIKAIFLFAIIIIHSFQLDGVKTGDFYKGFTAISYFGGAAIFLFVLGLGTVYSKNSQPRHNAIEGAKLIGYQALSNIANCAAMFIPFVLMGLFCDMSGKRETLTGLIKILLPYINIFFMAGVVYLILALLQKINLPKGLYLVLSLVIAALAPFYTMPDIENSIVDTLVGIFVGGPDFVSFGVIHYLAFSLAGVWFADLLTRVKNKDAFYVRVMIICGVLFSGMLIYYVWKSNGFAEFYTLVGLGYIYPDIINFVGRTAMVLLMAGLFHFMENIIHKAKPIDKMLMYFSQNISKYYAIHMAIFLLFFVGHQFIPFGTVGCLVLAAIVFILTHIVVVAYNHFLKKK